MKKNSILKRYFGNISKLFLTTALILMVSLLSAQQLAFPGAEGAGKFTKGGRGGDVYHVTNLNDSGEGSLRNGIKNLNGPRTIVFDVAGTIRLKDVLMIDGVKNLTIAGQTAPGKGITIVDYPVKIHNSENIIVRYLRIRLGDENKPDGSGFDCLEVNYNSHIILDHMSLSWGIDGNGDFRGLEFATLQWMIFSEALHNSLHEKGPHAMCTSFRDTKGYATMHHNIYASSRNRHPTVNAGKEVVEFCNNLNYNWRNGQNISGDQFNLIGNYFKPGPSQNPDVPLPIHLKTQNNPVTSKGYFSDNYFEGLNEKFNEDNYKAMSYKNTELGLGKDNKYQSAKRKEFVAERRFEAGIYSLTNIESAMEAYNSCLKYSGCSLERDMADERLIETIVNNTGRLIDSQSEVGGWDLYPEIKRPANWDTDGDGMPNDWEIEKGLDPNNIADGNEDMNNDGFTNLEEYMYGLVPNYFTIRNYSTTMK